MAPTPSVIHGDCLQVLAAMPTASIDAIVTDPPYELGFMGKKWDGSGIAYSVELWTEALRVLKPGGHLLAFGGTRTSHRMACAIEDAGFEIRDSIQWIYGSGFPKSLDVSKAIDKQKGNQAEVYQLTAWIRAARDAAKITNRDIDAAFAFAGMAGHWTSAASQPAVPTLGQFPKLLDVLGVDELPEEIRELALRLNQSKGQPGPNWAKREVTGQHVQPSAGQQWQHNILGRGDLTPKERRDISHTPEAKQWDGWGTALKPAHEPIVMARKPLGSTVAACVLEHGTGALNIGGCRIGTGGGCKDAMPRPGGPESVAVDGDGLNGRGSAPVEGLGRWPANVLFSHADGCVDECVPGCPVAELDRQSGGASRFFYVAKPSKRERNAGLEGLPEQVRKTLDGGHVVSEGRTASKSGATNPQANVHPTVKPTTLMRYLVRLITPPGGIVLDPFAGSGTTLVAATLEGHDSIGVELTAEYLPIIQGRTAWAVAEWAREVPALFPA